MTARRVLAICAVLVILEMVAVVLLAEFMVATLRADAPQPPAPLTFRTLAGSAYNPTIPSVTGQSAGAGERSGASHSRLGRSSIAPAGRVTPTTNPTPKSPRLVVSPHPPLTSRGLASWYTTDPSALAWPDGPGWQLRVCGAAGCRTAVSTDAGPDKAEQRAGRVIDLNRPMFEAVCGVPAYFGLCEVSVTVLGHR